MFATQFHNYAKVQRDIAQEIEACKPRPPYTQAEEIKPARNKTHSYRLSTQTKMALIDPDKPKIHEVFRSTTTNHCNKVQCLASCVVPGKPSLFGSGDHDGVVNLWSMTRREIPPVHVQKLLAHNMPIFGLDIRYQNGDVLMATAGYDKSVRLWKMGEGYNKFWRVSEYGPSDPRERHTKGIRCVRLLDSINALATTSMDRATKVWDMETQKCIRTFEGHKSAVFSCCESDHQLFSASWDSFLMAWDLRTGKRTHRFQAHRNGICEVKVKPGTRILGTSAKDKKIQLFDIRQMGIAPQLFSLKEAHRMEIRGFAFTSGSELVSGSADNTVKMWRYNTNAQPLDEKEELKIQDHLIATSKGTHTDEVNDVAVVLGLNGSPEEVTVVSASNDCSVAVSNVCTAC